MKKNLNQTSSQQDFLANLSQSQENKNQTKMTEISGRKLLELSKSPDPLGSLEKTLMELLNSISIQFLRTWKEKTTPQGSLIFQLQASVRGTKGKGSGLLRTPTTGDAKVGMNNIKGNAHRVKNGSIQLVDQILFPTPRASGQENAETVIKRKGIKAAIKHNLTAAVQMFPTLTAACETEGVQADRVEQTKSGAFILQEKNKPHMKYGANLRDMMHYSNNVKTGGQLNPVFVEHLMGFPMNWTKIDEKE